MVPKLQRALCKMKLGTKAYSRVLVPNFTIIFANSFPKILLLGKFGYETSKCDGRSVPIMQTSPSVKSVIIQ